MFGTVDKALLFSWLAPEDLDHLVSGHGEQELNMWMDGLLLPQLGADVEKLPGAPAALSPFPEGEHLDVVRI